MTDKEKIELIIQEKHLNNTQFCNEVCIAPGTLSHIRSGRTEPTLNILRSIAQAFPDINPAWLFYGEEPMYKKTDSSTPDNDEDEKAPINNVEETTSAEDGQLPLFAFSSGSPVRTGAANAGGASMSTSSSAIAPSRRDSVSTRSNSNALSVQEIVAETLKQQQKPPRKVVEVRIFFDDGTFETFSAN